MLQATVLFSRPDWLVPAAGLVVVAILALFWGYRSISMPQPYRGIAIALKCLGIFALAICLLEPLRSEKRPRPGANLFAVMADNSQGMEIRDKGDSKSRAAHLAEAIKNDQASWQRKLTEQFDVRHYLFDTRLHQTKDYSELDFRGSASAIGGALHTLSDRYQGRPLAGILMFTDGNATDLPNGVSGLSKLPPVYPVIVGEDVPPKDVAVENVTINQTAFEDSPVTVQATVNAIGYAGRPIVAQLIDQTGKKVSELTEKSDKDAGTIHFRFLIRPEKAGLSFYRLQVAAKDELNQFVDPKQSTEATLSNNVQEIVVDRGKGPHRILYVAGRPNWEYKFLSRALLADDQVQLPALMRVAKREPKFDFRGRPGETSNPLFRGFDKKDEETERYDKPVLRRFNTRDQNELRDGFPKTPEELYDYEAVIVDDLEAEFFTHDQLTLLQKFVSERGGGFLMLGGQESLVEGKYVRTPVADLLPVYVDRLPDSGPPTEARLDLSREGWLQPWVRLRNTESEEQKRISEMPPFQVVNRIRDIKPGASVLATVSDANGKRYPALIAQRFGAGRSGVLAIGDFWRWGLQSEELHKDMDKAWRQLIRWLIADVPARIELQIEEHPDSESGVLLKVKARNKAYQPLENASVNLEIKTVALIGTQSQNSTNQSGIKITAEASPSEPGVYQATFIPREAGIYQAEAVVTDSEGIEAGRTVAGWTTNPAAEEFRSLKPNRALMEKLAQQTGGEVITISKLEDLANRLPKKSAPIMEPWTSPLWHTPAVFLFALACFISEWGLRRWKGLT